MGAVIGGWVAVRTALLWPVAEIVPGLIHAVAPAAAAETAGRRGPFRAVDKPRQRRAVLVRTSPPLPVRASAAIKGGDGKGVAASDPPSFAPVQATVRFDSSPDPLPAGVDPPPVFAASRWSGSAWAILRPDGRATPFASQLGGSQAGARLAYALGGARRVALYARASTAIDAPEREAAVGVDWRPTRLPIHLVAERRVGIEGVRSGTAIGAVGGVGPTPLVGPLRVEGYAQGGVIFRDGREGFVDGSLRLTVPVIAHVDLGLGAWGGAQKGAARLDIGPTVGVAVPLAGRNLRLAADWRQRVAGNARPGSGPAVSLGMDF